ncbi:MAG: histidine phosphatase family protein [Candidatus Bathyarchaeota archaeon]
MVCKLFVFRHAETTDNARMIFSGWRDPTLTPKGFLQAQEVAEQLRDEEITYAFTSHLRRARMTLEVVLKTHHDVPIFVDDRLIERCYGLLQGKSKRRVERERPEWFAEIHRSYDFPPPEGESLKMVENRTLPFLNQLKERLQKKPGNVAISCHGNSMRPIRRAFEDLSIRQMLQIENPQDKAIAYALQCHEIRIEESMTRTIEADWRGVLIPRQVKLATNPRNPLKKYY